MTNRTFVNLLYPLTLVISYLIAGMTPHFAVGAVGLVIAYLIAIKKIEREENERGR